MFMAVSPTNFRLKVSLKVGSNPSISVFPKNNFIGHFTTVGEPGKGQLPYGSGIE
jgi:hypothetical protein